MEEEIGIRSQDQTLMGLVHYFVTEENYSPILVRGVKDEVWLENLKGPYRIIRINTNYIHNDEQFKVDVFKVKSVLKQIKRKTLSPKLNALIINLNENERVNNVSEKNIDTISFETLDEVKENKDIAKVFPTIKEKLNTKINNLDLIFNVTNDINVKTETENKKYEKIFSKKKIIVTYVIMALCILMYLVSIIMSKNLNPNAISLVLLGALNKGLVRTGEIYRIITYAFLHGSLIHILTNMYSLFVIGPQIESKFGKLKYILIYLISAIGGALLSIGFSDTISIGASGAIFGLLGALLYFGVNFRLYLKTSLTSRILPVIILNLLIGFMVPGIDNWGHIGGLVAGYLSAMAIGLPDGINKKDRVNGIILLTIFFIFLAYLAFIR